MKKKKRRRKLKRFPLREIFILGAIFLGIAFLFFIFLALQSIVYENKILAQVKIGKWDVSGKTYLKALEEIKDKAEALEEKGIILLYKDQKIIVPSQTISINPDIPSLELFRLEAESSIEKAYLIGRKGNIYQQITERLKAFFFGIQIETIYSLNYEELKEFLKTSLSLWETSIKDPSFYLQDSELKIKEGSSGLLFDIPQIIEKIRQKLKNLDDKPLEIKLVNVPPHFSKQEARPLLKLALKILDKAPLKLYYQDKEWFITSDQLEKWLNLKWDSKKKKVILGLNNQASADLKEIASQIDIPPQEGRFRMEEGKVIQFQKAHPGQRLDIEKVIKDLENLFNNLTNKKKLELELTVEEVPPRITTENIKTLGIKELIAEGRTNFAGSPLNRRHNIKIGAESLNGLIIMPGEVFSTLEAIGEVSAETGYLPELVIKGNRTVPEYGGGLCQVSTTLFRLVLNAGLPILERQNHSFRVSYYEPPVGMDATIYDPAPDFKFLNDYSTPLLLQTRIEGTELIYEFYGTKDGRTVEISEPKVFNIVPPPPTLYIKTPDLAPGTKKCTEKAVPGAQAEFTYKVTYPDGEVKIQIFSSHYRPWQAVCLIGQEESQPKPEETKNNILLNTNLNANLNLDLKNTDSQNINSSSKTSQGKD